MSNKIPDMENPEDFPYCIWYPETATEETYRALAARYPWMKYLVGRACAVAGYVGLFHELGLLPDRHIAEEARESKQWEIYEAIMDPEVRYNAMDDYTTTVFDKPVRGCLNADTAVRSYLENKTEFRRPFNPDDSDGSLTDWMLGPRRDAYFDTSEDGRIYERPSVYILDTEVINPEDDVGCLLYMPLPADLPTMNKDLLI